MGGREGAGATAGTVTASAAYEREMRWRHVPLALYTIPMSFVGLGLAMRRAATSSAWPGAGDAALNTGATALFALTLASLALILALHAVKAVRHPDQMWTDLTHPIRICFAAVLPMTLVLIAVAAHPEWPRAAHAVWLVGSLLYAAVGIFAVGLWQRRAPLDIALLNPAWFLPIVGPILIAHCGPRLGYVETSWMIVALSFTLWLVIQTLLVYRNIFAPPLPPRLLPTLTIQVGPAPLIFLALVELQPGLDPFMRMMHYAGLGIFVLLWLPRVPQFWRLPFAMPHWSFSFPLSAMTASMLAYAERTNSPELWQIGKAFLLLPLAVTLYAAFGTLRAWRQGVFSRPEL